MRASSKWCFAGSMLLPLLLGCGKKEGGISSGDDGTSPGDDASVTGSNFYGGDDSGGFFGNGDDGGDNGDNGPCKGGFYSGSFGGLYSSHITLFGINIPVTGDVQLTLKQQGSGKQMCTFEGESEECSDVFSLQDGTISGVADAVHTGDASFLGFPYFCTMTGTLGCKEKKLEDGWIECTYCLGDLADGGRSCVNGDGLGGTIGTGGQFAGPLTADYFYSSGDAGSGPPMFGTLPQPFGDDPGAWNGTEALSDQHSDFYSGTGPLPDGGTLADYISDAGYGKIGAMNDFGGYGWWYATYQHP